MDIAVKTPLPVESAPLAPYQPEGTPLPTELHGRPIESLQVGDSVAIERTLRQTDLDLFALISGDVNPQHTNPEFAAGTFFKGVIAHGMWGGALISAVLGSLLPGPGTIYLSQNLRFLAPVRVGDTLTVRVTVATLDTAKRRVTLDCRCTNQQGEAVIEGQAQVMPPKHASTITAARLPRVLVG